MKRWLSGVAVMGGATMVMLTVAAWTRPASEKQEKAAQIARGRQVVIEHDCGGCHGGGAMVYVQRKLRMSRSAEQLPGRETSRFIHIISLPQCRGWRGVTCRMRIFGRSQPTSKTA